MILHDLDPQARSPLTEAYCTRLESVLDAASRLPPALPSALSIAGCVALLKRCERLLNSEPTLVVVTPPAGAEVVVIGDLHGQLHDLLAIFQELGRPSQQRVFIFDGDLVDRGAWSLETLLLAAAWKAAAPQHCFILRGNHESAYCSTVYGFQREVEIKCGNGKEGQAVFQAALKLFQALPLAAVVAGSTLVLHGGLPRAPPPRRATRSTVAAAATPGSEVVIATLDDIRASSKGGDDPDPAQPEQRLAVDVLWSDPGSLPGVQLGARPGNVGIRFGPDVTERFLRDHGLRLILRGHEGPDARVLRDGEMPDMLNGWTLDHDTPSGRLYTVFSAPQYPQSGGQQHDNLGAVAVLAGPGYDEPRFVQFSAAPRPQTTCFIPDLPVDGDGDVEAPRAAS